MARVVVVGGGIAGLSVALWRAKAGDQVSVYEASSVLGGQLQTVRDGGFVVEQGAEGFVAASEVVAALATELGIEGSLVGQLLTASCRFEGGALRVLGPGEAAQSLGFQVPKRDLGRGIRAFRSGMAEIIEALARALGPIADVRVSTPVKRLIPRGDVVELDLGAARQEADRVVVATSSHAAAELLAGAFGAPARSLADSAVSSSVTVSLAYRRNAIAHALDATGFVVPDTAEQGGFRACTFTSSKLPARAPADHALLRAFFRPTAADLAELDDAGWSERAERALAHVLAPSERPVRAWVARWPDALPVFDAAHDARIAALEAALAGSGVSLAGAAFHGSGIDAALRSARRAVEHSV